jgi:1,4-dihydroxy-2-naphthoate octaprenyltransferase
LPVGVAVASAAPMSKWNWPVLIASALAVGLLHCAGNLLNDYFDFTSGVDHKVQGDENRPGRVLVKRKMTPREVLAQALACIATVGGLAVFIVWQCWPWGLNLLWFAGAGLVSLYIYTAPPLALKYHALGEPLIFLIFGPTLMLGAAYAQTGRLELQALLASIPVGLATTAILVGNNIRDLDEDRRSGITTLSRVIGHGRLRAVYVALVTLSVTSAAVLAGVGLFPRALIASPLLLVLLAKPLRAVIADRRMADIDARTAQFETVLLLAMLLLMVH